MKNRGTAAWRMELRQLIAAIKANEVNVYEVREILQQIYLQEFEPAEVPTRSALEECFSGSHNLARTGFHSYLNEPVQEFILWGELIASKIKTARKFFESREMKRLIPLWRERYREGLRKYFD